LNINKIVEKNLQLNIHILSIFLHILNLLVLFLDSFDNLYRRLCFLIKHTVHKYLSIRLISLFFYLIFLFCWYLVFLFVFYFWFLFGLIYINLCFYHRYWLFRTFCYGLLLISILIKTRHVVYVSDFFVYKLVVCSFYFLLLLPDFRLNNFALHLLRIKFIGVVGAVESHTSAVLYAIIVHLTAVEPRWIPINIVIVLNLQQFFLDLLAHFGALHVLIIGCVITVFWSHFLGGEILILS